MSEPIVTAEDVIRILEHPDLPSMSLYHQFADKFNALLAPIVQERESKYAELVICVRGLLAWKGEERYIRDTDGSRKQLALVVRALAELGAAAPKVSESQNAPVGKERRCLSSENDAQ